MPPPRRFVIPKQKVGLPISKARRYFEPARKVEAPLIAECCASFACKLKDDSLVSSYNFFIFEVVKAHVAPRPKYPQTLHYTGDGEFIVSGEVISRRSQFRPGML
jgi:flavin reductase (DIM6/NTAB) family NADH-FMN oxidoreductase RutF